MPTYEYLCKTCSHRFETWQKMTAEPLSVCPECGGTIRRVPYPAGIVFKGSGFYKTDHPAGGTPHESHESKAASSETGSSGESKESKSTESATPASTPANSSESGASKTPANAA